MATSKNIDSTQLKELHENGLTTSDIAKTLGIAASTVVYWKKKLDIKLSPNKHDWKKIQEAHDNGASYTKLYEMFGVCKRSLQNARNRGDFKVRQIPKVPKEHRRAKQRENWARYHAKKKYNTPHDEDLTAIKEFYKNCPERYEVDHIIPISRGGKHSISNLQYLTISENRSKGNKIIEAKQSNV